MIRSCALVLVLTIAAPAMAEQSSPLKVAWQDGLIVQSEDGDYRFRLGTVLQTDGRMSPGAPATTNTFLIRKARLVVGARLARYFEFRVVPDLASSALPLPDAYVDTRFSSRFRLRVGKDKTPVGYELLMPDANGWFPERALTSSLVPNRDIGVQAQGDLGRTVSYAAGVFNGVPDGASADADTNHAKDVAGRVVIQPVRGIGVHVGASTGHEASALPSFKTAVGQTFFAYASGTVASGRHTRVSPAIFYYRRSFGTFAEYARSTQEVARGAASRTASNSSWTVNASYALTGEAVSDRNVRPTTPFDPVARHWGALQVLARYGQLHVDRGLFGGFAASGASRAAGQFTVALNWYPTNFVKWYASYERTAFSQDAYAARPAENAVIVRGQLAF